MGSRWKRVWTTLAVPPSIAASPSPTMGLRRSVEVAVVLSDIGLVLNPLLQGREILWEDFSVLTSKPIDEVVSMNIMDCKVGDVVRVWCYNDDNTILQTEDFFPAIIGVQSFTCNSSPARLSPRRRSDLQS